MNKLDELEKWYVETNELGLGRVITEDIVWLISKLKEAQALLVDYSNANDPFKLLKKYPSYVIRTDALLKSLKRED